MFQCAARRARAVAEITGVTADIGEGFHDEFPFPGHIASEITDVMMNRLATRDEGGLARHAG